MRISSVKAHHFDFSIWGGFGDREDSLPLVTPMAIYPEYKEPVTSWHASAGTCVVEIQADNGLVGLGWCEDFCGAASMIIRQHLSRFLIGKDSGDVSRIWEQMYRSSIMYGRKGIALFAISALDIALWDLLGKQASEPVYRLMGGKVRDRAAVYASHLHAIEPEKLAAEAQGYLQQGYRAMKLRFGFGPADGLEGINKNVAQVALLRETVGNSVDLMADAYMGWTVEYTQRIAKKLERFDLKWLEEPLLPDEIEGYVELSRTIGVPVAAGEHEYTRYGFQTLIHNRAVSFVQFDLGRVGGLTEARRVCQMASAAGLPVCPHAYSLPTLHLAFSEPACLMVEYFPVPCWVEDGYEDKNPFGTPQPRNGSVGPPDEPGLGAHLDFEMPSGTGNA